MLGEAKLRYLRISPRKVRLVADLIRGKPVLEAKNILSFTNKRSAPILLKLLNQAIANTKNQYEVKEEELYISKITVDEGPRYKRWRPVSRGMAHPIQKKTSHIHIVLDTLKKEKPKRIVETKTKKEAEKIIQKEPKELAKEKAKEPEIQKEKKETEKSLILAKDQKAPSFKQRIQKGLKKMFRRKAF